MQPQNRTDHLLYRLKNMRASVVKPRAGFAIVCCMGLIVLMHALALAQVAPLPLGTPTAPVPMTQNILTIPTPPVLQPSKLPPWQTPAPVTPAPPAPDAQGHWPATNGVTDLVWTQGRPLVVDCATQTICPIWFPDTQYAGLSGVAAGPSLPNLGQNNATPNLPWSVVPQQEGSDLWLAISPYMDSPSSTIILLHTTGAFGSRSYLIQLVREDFTQPTVYRCCLTPNRSNVVTLPQPVPRVYATATPQASGAFGEPVAPAPCPAAYVPRKLNNPNFWPESISILPSQTVKVAFSASQTLPTVGLFLQGHKNDLFHLGEVGVSYDAYGSIRAITVLACYPSIVFYSTDDRGRHAVVLDAVEATPMPPPPAGTKP
jgi:hypothetical protein